MYKYAIESESGFPIVTITYTNAFNNVIEVKRPYTHMDDADKYVQGHMRNWLGDKLTRYIKHKSVLLKPVTADITETQSGVMHWKIARGFNHTLDYPN